ncbi:MAG: hypothetical protein WCH31_02255 [Actinomycetes bacterium]
MGQRVLPACLVALAAFADSHGQHALARDFLLGALPFAAVAAMIVFGDYLESKGDAVVALQSLLWGLVVVMLLLSCALRSTAVTGVPPLAVSSLAACLGIFAIKAFVAAAPYARRLALRPAKP